MGHVRSLIMVADRAVQADAAFVDVAELLTNYRTRRARIGIIGLGYVGIPLALTAAKAGFQVLGFDIDEPRVQQINRGESFIKHIAPEHVAEAINDKKFEATADFNRLGEADAILICVPTPLFRPVAS